MQSLLKRVNRDGGCNHPLIHARFLLYNERMKTYELIIIGTGSAMNILEPYLHHHPDASVAVIDKDEPGGICLTRGCIPSKILLYPAELVQSIGKAKELGIDVEIKNIHFRTIMERMRLMVSLDMLEIKESLEHSDSVDFYQETAEFVEPYILKVGEQTIKGEMVFLCTGSEPLIPDIDGLQEVDYHTSIDFLQIEELPSRWAVIGGGYIAAEYGHFLASMGTEVTIFGRNPQFLKEEEPEISDIAVEALGKRMNILTGWEVIAVKTKKSTGQANRPGESTGEIQVSARHVETGEEKLVTVEAILVAAGRRSTAHYLKPEKGGIETTGGGWIKADDHLETSQKNVWAIGDALGTRGGRNLFKHVANYESEILYYNAVEKEEPRHIPDYSAIPHAVFTYPEIAAVGLREKEAIEEHGEDQIAIGFSLFEHTAKGMAMDLYETGYFVKVILHRKDGRVLGAHIIGPEASVLIHQIIAVMYAPEGRHPFNMMHIHPALNEVVANAFGNLMTVEDYHHYLGHLTGEFGPDHDHNH